MRQITFILTYLLAGMKMTVEACAYFRTANVLSLRHRAAL